MTPTAVAIGIVEHAGRFLVGVRQPGQAMPGRAEFPGGKLEPGETVEQAVCREVWEETGLRVRPTDWRREVEHHYPHGWVRLTFVRCLIDGPGEPHAPFRWVSREELTHLPFPPANEEVLRDLLGDGVGGTALGGGGVS